MQSFLSIVLVVLVLSAIFWNLPTSGGWMVARIVVVCAALFLGVVKAMEQMEEGDTADSEEEIEDR